MKNTIINIGKKYSWDKTRLLDIYWDIQDTYTFVPPESLIILSEGIGLSVPELKDTLTFYHFFHDKPAGKIRIYVDTSAISELAGLTEVIATFEEVLGCKIGNMDPTGQFGLYPTSCIGMSDQAPAALVNGFPIVNLHKNKIRKIVADLKKNILPTVRVTNTVHLEGDVFFDVTESEKTAEYLRTIEPTEIIKIVSDSGVRGRGGAGFSTGKKWSLCASQKEKTRYVVCNADEGEPGTFKDRFLLTEMAEFVFEGMVIAARAISAESGFVYLRAEYRYLRGHLENVLANMRKKNVLGKDILGISDFNFDIRIQLGAGSYVVGEETALLESLEGKRGEPRVRPPFPVENGYLGKPTVINNVETFASVARIVRKGPDWYRKFGTLKSPGTKLLSVSGDCLRPGIHEVEWGTSIGTLLELIGAIEPLAIQVGGPSGNCIDAREKHRTIAFEDLATGGSIMVFGKNRNMLKVIKNFTQFFVDESCGCCLPCRAGNIVLNEQMDYIISGEAAMIDLERIKSWSKIISPSSRCGLGQTCTNPMVTSLNAFPELYRSKVKEHESLYRPFDVESKTASYDEIVSSHAEKN